MLEFGDWPKELYCYLRPIRWSALYAYLPTADSGSLSRLTGEAYQVSTRELRRSPLESEGLRDLMPSAAGMPVTVVGAHARALAVVAVCIPAGRGALLLLLVELDHVDLTIPLERPVDEPIEPGLRSFPPLHVGDPFRLISAVTP
jgi:hypothetical protein